MGTISVGTPPQNFTGIIPSAARDPSHTVSSLAVDFDTGSSDILIPSVACNTTCDGHRRYDASQSTTSHFVNASFSLRYGDGSTAVGELYTDNVLIGGYEVFLMASFMEPRYNPFLSGKEPDVRRSSLIFGRFANAHFPGRRPPRARISLPLSIWYLSRPPNPRFFRCRQGGTVWRCLVVRLREERAHGRRHQHDAVQRIVHHVCPGVFASLLANSDGRLVSPWY